MATDKQIVSGDNRYPACELLKILENVPHKEYNLFIILSEFVGERYGILNYIGVC